MKSKLLRARQAAGGAGAALLAGCMLTLLCLDPWSALVTDVNFKSVGSLSAAAEENADVWDGDLVAAGWFGDEGKTKPDEYEVKYKSGEEGEVESVTIGSAAALAYFSHEVYVDAENYYGAQVTLTTDINLNNKLWIPIGFTFRSDDYEKEHIFSGKFSGGEEGHTIFNLDAYAFNNYLSFNEYAFKTDDELNDVEGVDSEDNDYWLYLDYSSYDQEADSDLRLIIPSNDDGKYDEKGFVHEYVYGLFGVAGNIEISNLNIVNVTLDFDESEYVSSKDTVEVPHVVVADSVGTFIGYAKGSLKLENCTAGSKEGRLGTVSDTTDSIGHVSCAGGLVGRAYSGLYNGVACGRSVNHKTDNILNEGYTLGTIEFINCTNYVSIGSEDDGDKKGGIIGYAYSNLTLIFENCVNYGDVMGQYAGGMISYWQDNGIKGYYSGDAVNYEWKFEDCINYGNVTGAAGTGGLIGRSGSKNSSTDVTYKFEITGCKNYGRVTNNVDAASVAQTGTASSVATGGIVGYYYLFDEQSCTFQGNFNYGTVTGVRYNPNKYAQAATGGLIGYLNLSEKMTGTNPISGGNYGKVVGCIIYNNDGCIGGCNSDFADLSYKYLINAYAAKAEEIVKEEEPAEDEENI